ncbi:MAG: hypothetical protein Q8J89_13430 [Caulobacter sp.]|nr:hypothetical protein [Caulobacter sp.]
MTFERFQLLAEAWGGAIARWPAETQDAAYAFMAAAPERADAVLAEARATDALLDAAVSPAPSAALRDHVIARAPAARPERARLWRWMTGAGVGAALTAATAAGVMAGVNLSLARAPVGEDDALLTALYDTGLADDFGGSS